MVEKKEIITRYIPGSLTNPVGRQPGSDEFCSLSSEPKRTEGGRGCVN